MNNEELDKYLRVAKKACGEAGKYLKNNFGKRKVQTEKERGHWGIVEDLESNQIYERILKQGTSAVSLYSEEGARNTNSELMWVVDPIEGTTNYASGVPFFATQIALLYGNEPVVSVVHAPMFNETYWATKDGGAFLNGDKIKVAKNNLRNGLVWIDKGKDSSYVGKLIIDFADKVKTLRWMGAMGLNMAYVARGTVDLFLNKGSELYDYAPGVLLVREAGGRVIDFSGNDWTITTSEVVAGNVQIVDEGLRVLKPML